MILRQTLSEAIDGYWDGGLKKEFDWKVDGKPFGGFQRVGSWDANYYFSVKVGNTEKQTLANARRALTNRIKKTGLSCTFEYIGE